MEKVKWKNYDCDYECCRLRLKVLKEMSDYSNKLLSIPSGIKHFIVRLDANRSSSLERCLDQYSVVLKSMSNDGDIQCESFDLGSDYELYENLWFWEHDFAEVEEFDTFIKEQISIFKNIMDYTDKHFDKVRCIDFIIDLLNGRSEDFISGTMIRFDKDHRLFKHYAHYLYHERAYRIGYYSYSVYLVKDEDFYNEIEEIFKYKGWCIASATDKLKWLKNKYKKA